MKLKTIQVIPLAAILSALKLNHKWCVACTLIDMVASAIMQTKYKSSWLAQKYGKVYL